MSRATGLPFILLLTTFLHGCWGSSSACEQIEFEAAIITTSVPTTIEEGRTVELGIAILPGCSSSFNGVWTQTGGPEVVLANATFPISEKAPAAARFVAPNVGPDGAKLQFAYRLEFGPSVREGTVEIEITDNSGEDPVASDNKPPLAVISGPASVEEREEGALLGSGSSDEDGTIVDSLWEQVSGPLAAIEDADRIDTSFTAPELDGSDTELIFRLTVTDDDGATHEAETVIVVREVNRAPVVDAGADQTVAEGDTVTLAASAEDPDGDGIAAWNWVSASDSADGVTLTTPEAPTTTFTAPEVGPEGLTLSFQVTARDDREAGAEPASDTVIVTVRDINVPIGPVTDADASQVSVETGSPVGTEVGLTVTARDPDGESVRFELLEDGGAFAIDAVTGVVTTAIVVDVADRDRYTITVQARSSDGTTASAEFVITVTEVNRPPKITLVFPPADGIAELANVDVIGRFEDPEGDSVVVEAAGGGLSLLPFVDDDLNVFRAEDLELVDADDDGSFSITVSGEDATTGRLTDTLEAELRESAFWIEYGALALDVTGKRLFSIDAVIGAVMEQDLAGGGPRTIATAAGNPAFRELHDIAWDPAAGRIILYVDTLNFVNEGVVALDPASGIATILSNDEIGTGARLANSAEVAVDPRDGTIYVGESINGDDRIRIVDPVTGDRTLLSTSNVSDGPVGGGDRLRDVASLVVDAANDRLLVADRSSDSVVAVDLGTGARSILASDSVGSGVSLDFMTDLVVSAAGDRVWVLVDPSAVVEVDLASGDRTTVSDSSDAFGGAGWSPIWLALDGEQERLLVSGYFPPDFFNTSGLLEVALGNGRQEVLAVNEAGSGVRPFLGSVLHDPENDRLIMVEYFSGIGSGTGLVALNRATGERTRLTDDAAPGAAELDYLRAIALSSGELYGIRDQSSTAPALLRIDLEAGAHEVLSGAGRGEGPAFQEPVDLALADDGSTAWVLDARANAVFQVDLASGDRTLFSGEADGPIAVFGPEAIVLDNDLGVLWMADDEGLYHIDLATGARTFFSGEDDEGNQAGSGVEVYFKIVDMHLDVPNERVLLIFDSQNSSRTSVIAVDRFSGHRKLLSGQDVGSGVAHAWAQGHGDFDAETGILWISSELGFVVVVNTRTGERIVESY